MFRSQRIELFKQARIAFLQGGAQQFCGNVKIFRMIEEESKNKFVVFGIKKEEQDQINFDALRIEIAREMGFAEPKQYIQFIGDSHLYSREGTSYAKHKLAQILEQDRDSIVLYGYTGSKEKEGTQRRDINQLLSDWVDEDPMRANRVVANIVDEHTITAINQWGCTFSENVRYFFLVHSDTKEPSVKFGDDIASSDGLTSLKTYSFEGGVQALRQMMYMLKRDVAIHGILNLRDLSDPSNPVYFDPVFRKPYLSAVEFIQTIKESSVEFYKAAEDYLSRHALYNKNKGDALTKEALWVTAWEELVSGVRNKLSLFTCESNLKIMSEDISASALVAISQQQTRNKIKSVTSRTHSTPASQFNYIGVVDGLDPKKSLLQQKKAKICYEEDGINIPVEINHGVILIFRTNNGHDYVLGKARVNPAADNPTELQASLGDTGDSLTKIDFSKSLLHTLQDNIDKETNHGISLSDFTLSSVYVCHRAREWKVCYLKLVALSKTIFNDHALKKKIMQMNDHLNGENKYGLYLLDEVISAAKLTIGLAEGSHKPKSLLTNYLTGENELIVIFDDYAIATLFTERSKEALFPESNAVTYFPNMIARY